MKNQSRNIRIAKLSNTTTSKIVGDKERVAIKKHVAKEPAPGKTNALSNVANVKLEASGKKLSGTERVKEKSPTHKRKKIILAMKSGTYTRNGFGVFVACESGVKKVCSYIRCDEFCTDANTGFVSILIKFKDHHNQVKKLLVPRAEFNKPASLIERLLNFGFDVYDNKVAKSFLFELHQYEPPKKNVVIASRPGWNLIRNDKQQAFVTSEKVFEPENVTSNMVLDDAVNMGLSRSGTLKAWQDNVAALCRGNPRLIFMLCASLSGPLLALLGYRNFGIHIFGQSLSGKTTGAIVASSVYGPKEFCSSWNSTSNALQETAISRNDFPLLLDEISQCDKKQASAAAYDIMNGVTKGRLGSDSKLNAGTHFRLVVISTGEFSFEEHLHQGGIKVKPGQLARLISIPLHSENGMFSSLHGCETKSDFASKLLKNTDAYYGTAGPEFIRHLVDNQERLRESLSTQVNEIVKFLLDSIHVNDNEPTELQRSVAKSMAVIACSGELAISYGVFPWTKDDAIKAARGCFKAWNRHEKESARARDFVYASLKQFFSDNKNDFLPLDEYAENKQKTVYRSRVVGNKAYVVTPEYFEGTLCSEFTKKDAIEALKKRGLLVLSTRGGPTRPVTIPRNTKQKERLGRPGFYVIKERIHTTA